MTWEKTGNLCKYIVLALTLLIQFVTLVKLIRSGNYKVFTKITVIFIISNVALTAYYYSSLESSRLHMISTFNVIFWGFLSFGHWMFSFEYFNMARIIPFVLNGVAPPENLVKSNKV